MPWPHQTTTPANYPVFKKDKNTAIGEFSSTNRASGPQGGIPNPTRFPVDYEGQASYISFTADSP